MKLQNTIFICLIACLAFQNCFGQQTPKAELIDEFGSITWEELAARLDNLMNQLGQQPNTVAYVVIHNGKVINNRERFRYEQWTRGQLKARDFDEKRFYIIRAEDRNQLQIQFWLVPDGAKKPSFSKIKWDVALSTNAKAQIFTKTDWQNGLATPPEYLSLNLFSEYLQGNPTARGYFVIKERSREKFRNEQSNITNILTDKYKIKPERLRFFYLKENKLGWDYPDVEVWLVPQKKK